MLVLSRKKDEKVVLPTLGITIHVCKISEHKVKLGFDAPTDIPIHRSELLQENHELHSK